MSNMMSTVFIGYVVEVLYKDSIPTLELRVRVPSIHGNSSRDGVKDINLPIAKPMIMAGAVYNKESFIDVISKLKKVYVIFESGNMSNPVYFGVKGDASLYQLPASSTFIKEYATYLDLPSIGNLAYLYKVLDTSVLYMWDSVHSVYTPFIVPSIATDSVWFDHNSGLTQGDITDIGRLFYDIERHTLTFLTDLGEYIEIGSNLGDSGKNDNGDIWEGQPVTLSGVQGSSPIKEFVLADSTIPTKCRMVGVLTTSNTPEGRLTAGSIGKISVFGDVQITDWSKILDSAFLTTLGITEYKYIPFGTKLYLSALEVGKYSVTAPAEPAANIWVATVIHTQTDNKKGRIFVHPQHEFAGGGASDTFVGTVRLYTNLGLISGHVEIDGIMTEENDKVLIAGAYGLDDAIYSASSGPWTKMLTVYERSIVAVEEGLLYAGTMLKVNLGIVTVVKKSELTKWTVS